MENQMIDHTEGEEQTELVVEEENDASEQLEGREHEPEQQPISKRRKTVAKNGGATNSRWTSGSVGVFTFMLKAVERLLWYLLTKKKINMETDSLSKDFYRIWFLEITEAASKICRNSGDRENGLDVLLDQCRKRAGRWNYREVCPPPALRSILSGIKTRIKKKDNPFIEDLPDNALDAAWPSVCDAVGFSFEVTFKPRNKDLGEDTFNSMQPELQSLIAKSRPCCKCWNCGCGATQKISMWQIHSEHDFESEKNKVLELSRIIGMQEAVMKEHWNESDVEWSSMLATKLNERDIMKKDLVKQSVEIKNLKEKVEELKKEVDLQREKACKVEKFRDELEQVKKEYIDVEKKVQEQKEIDKAIQVMCLHLQEIKQVVNNCRGCKRKCDSKHIL